MSAIVIATVAACLWLFNGLGMLLYPERVREIHLCNAAVTDAQWRRVGLMLLVLGAVALLCVVL